MPRERLSMRKIRDVLRLHARGLSKRRIADSLTIGRTAVGDYINRARRAGLGWPLPEGISEVELERRLFPPPRVDSPDLGVSDLLCMTDLVHASSTKEHAENDTIKRHTGSTSGRR
jgi:hypothetical protein